jgi:Fe-S cluster assembly protein SufD
MSAVAERFDSYTTAFEAFRREPVFGPEPVRAAREAAFGRFLERGFPSTREEEWRFTSVAPIAAMPFERGAAMSLDRTSLEPYTFPTLPTIVLVNGRLSTPLSSIDRLPAGVTLTSLSALGWLLQSPASRRHAPANVFVDLNSAFLDDGVVIDVAAGVVVSEPIHVLVFAVGGPRPGLVAPRLIVRVGDQSQVSIVESYAGLAGEPTLTSAVTEITLGAAAVVEHTKIQREAPRAFHVASTFVEQGRSSTFRSQALTFGSRIARNDIAAELGGDGAECTLNGLYVANDETLVDTHTTIDHAKPHCPSHEVYKGILGGRARAVFNGKIIVRPDAQKTDAKQTNKALLLSDEAQVNTKPQLEIFADDVKCTHGAAIGQLDEDAMFYLRARGLDEREARSLLIHAFAGQILDGIREPVVRERVQEVLDRKLSIVHE